MSDNRGVVGGRGVWVGSKRGFGVGGIRGVGVGVNRVLRNL